MFTLASLRSPLLLAVLLSGLTPAPETHPFDLTRDQKQSFTFAADQPGKIVARVTWQGAPLAVSLIGPGGTVAQRTARGSVELVYAVTPADVSKGSAWRVALQDAERTGNGIVVVAKGTVIIDHPPGDIQKLKARFDAQQRQRLAQFRAQAAKLQPQEMAAQKAQVARYQQALDQARQQARVARLQQVVALRARATAQPVRTGVVPGTVGARPSPVVGSGSGSSAPEPLSITSLSSSEGQPGDAILINGSGFGQSAAASGAAVHLIVAPGKDVQLTPDFWSDNQIQTSIPSDITGAADNQHAVIYVKTAGSSSQLVPFHFKPAIVTASISINVGHADLIDESDCDIEDSKIEVNSYWTAGGAEHGGGAFCGGSGNDIWNRGQQLKNGWKVVNVDFGVRTIYPDADVYVSQSHPGTSDLSFTMHWWTSGGGFGSPGIVYYSPVIYIQGPAGIAWQ